MKRQFHIKIGDFAPAQTTRTLTPEGFLLCKDAKLAKAPQIRQYNAYEFGGIEGFSNDQVINVFTSDAELFNPATIQSFQGVDATDDHPPGNVMNAATWRSHHIGTVSNVRQEDGYLVADLLIKDSNIVQQIQSNQRLELSLGYAAELDLTGGTSPDGTPYQAEFKNIEGNHVALVQWGRAGPDCRIGDRNNQHIKPKGKSMEIKVNGIRFEIGDNQALADALQLQEQQLENLKAAKLKIGDKEFSLSSEVVAVQAVADSLQTENTQLKQQVVDLQANQVTPEKLEALANERATVIADAKKLNPDVKTEGASCEQIKRDAIAVKAGDALVGAILGAVAVGDAKPDQVDTVFRALLATASTTPAQNPLNDLFVGDGKNPNTPNGNGQQGNQSVGNSKANAWKQSFN
ncbi:DUF2213 domain-containing protein [Acinetobacter sp. ME22]|uniref:DUF2213 domain-containing protein n=1 Tax=Acinetobacter sp. ME22 TaxID=2904802 RepID=UPI001EDAB743|nr:DUF2213 domain-containing protein [Acinetobacter sp. ME22]MCG2572342.1 DUF2213 domain-containing protein [Acinetobacter sp. ME22]